MTEDFTAIESHPRYGVSRDGTIINDRNNIKVPQETSNGYLKVDLYDNGKKSSKRIHRLVAEAYIPNPYNKPDVNHKDGNKHNNSVDNLEWVTKSENMTHAYQTGLNKPHPTYGMLGHKNPNGGRKGRKVMISETGDVFDSIKECAEFINGSDRRICDCINGKQDSYMNYHFETV